MKIITNKKSGVEQSVTEQEWTQIVNAKLEKLYKVEQVNSNRKQPTTPKEVLDKKEKDALKSQIATTFKPEEVKVSKKKSK
jgi:hypothetical protein